MTAKLLIIEDHGLMAQSLASALRQQPDIDVAVAYVTAETDVLARVADERPDVVLLDLDLGGRGSGVPLIEPIRDRETQVVMVTGIVDRVRHAECVEAGAVGVISKSSSFEELLRSVGEVLEGRALLTKHERDELLALLREHRRAEQARFADFDALTPREQHVLAELMAGKQVRDIASESVVSVATVRSQVRSVLTKLGVRSQVAAVSRAQRAGWRPAP